MRKTIEMLAAFNVTDLEKLPKNINNKNGENPKDIEAFLIQLKKDFTRILPTEVDTLKQAENLLAALLKIKRNNPQAFSKDMLEKLDLISQIDLNANGETGFLVMELCNGVNTAKEDSVQDLEQQLIGYKMDAIIKALNKAPPNQKAVIDAYLELGTFLQDQFPGQSFIKILSNLKNKEVKVQDLQQPLIASMIEYKIDAIIAALKKKPQQQEAVIDAYLELGTFLQDQFPGQSLIKILSNLKLIDQYLLTQLPPLDLHFAIKESRARLCKLSKMEHKKEALEMNALSAGISAFAKFMGESRINNEATNNKHEILSSSLDEKALVDVQKTISNKIYNNCKLSNLIESVKNLSEVYSIAKVFGVNKGQIKYLIKELETIVALDETSDQKYERALVLLSSRFEELGKKANSPNKRFFWQSGKVKHNNFVELLNDPKNKRHHTFARMLGTILRDAIEVRSIQDPNMKIRGEEMLDSLDLNKLELTSRHHKISKDLRAPLTVSDLSSQKPINLLRQNEMLPKQPK